MNREEMHEAAGAELRRILERAQGLAADDWGRPTRCPGWRISDLVWHVARQRTDSAETPDPTGIQERLREKTDAMTGTAPPDAELALGTLVEYTMHRDDLDIALGSDEPIDGAVARHLVVTRVEQAVGWASEDGLQPVAPRGYRVVGEDIDAGFYFDGDGWRAGHSPEVPTCTFESDPTTLCRLVFGRIPVTPFQAAESERAWDPRLRLSGDLRVALPFDFMRWCYGAW